MKKLIKMGLVIIGGSIALQMIILLVIGGASCSRHEEEFIREKKSTPLHYAIFSKRYNRALALLQNGADPNARDKFGSTPLKHAASNEDRNLSRILLEHGADPDFQNENGFSPLHIAALGGRTNVAETLLSHGANPNLRNTYGDPPLATIIYNQNQDFARLLLENGADPNFQNKNGWTALFYAINQPQDTGIKEGWTLERAAQMVKLLLKHGADPNVEKPTPPLYKAIKDDNLEIAKILLEHGANPHLREGESTPFNLAFEKELDELLELMETHPLPPKEKHFGFVMGETSFEEALNILRAKGAEIQVETLEDTDVKVLNVKGYGKHLPIPISNLIIQFDDQGKVYSLYGEQGMHLMSPETWADIEEAFKLKFVQTAYRHNAFYSDSKYITPGNVLIYVDLATERSSFCSRQSRKINCTNLTRKAPTQRMIKIAKAKAAEKRGRAAAKKYLIGESPD